MAETTKHVLCIKVVDTSGVLARVSGLFSARGYNIASFTVSPLQEEGLSRMTIVTFGENKIAAQIVSHLHKLVDVVEVIKMPRKISIDREVLLLKLEVVTSKIQSLRKLFVSCGASVVSKSEACWIVEKTDTNEAISKFIENVGSKVKILEFARSGVIYLLSEGKIV